MMKKRTHTRPKIGDIIEIALRCGFAYCQFLGKHHYYGAAIRVYPNRFENHVHDFSWMASSSGYVTFYPLGSAVRQKLVAIVGSLPVLPGMGVPSTLRRAGAIGPNGEILAWIIEYSEKEELRRELADEEKALPIAAIWNHEMLVIRIENGWSPSDRVTTYQ